MIIPPCAWFTDTKKTSNGTTTTTRQWYYLRFSWNDVGCNARATFKTSTTTASDRGSVASFAAKLFFVDNPGVEGGYNVYMIKGTYVYSNKSVSDFDIEYTFTGSADSQYTFTGMYPITAARQTGQSYTIITS
jgi:hypothetical protein